MSHHANPFSNDDHFSSAKIKERFRGFLPVVIDIETSGVDPFKNALLEISAVLIGIDSSGLFYPHSTYFENVLPHEGAVMDPESLAFINIDPYHPLRFAIDEKQALKNIFTPINNALKKTGCQKAVLVGHNAWFDLLFIKEAVKRTKLKSPFHSFTCFDTATLAGLIYGQTVLSKSVEAAGIDFDSKEAHSAIYDAEKTSALFCKILNIWEQAKPVNSKI